MSGREGLGFMAHATKQATLTSKNRAGIIPQSSIFPRDADQRGKEESSFSEEKEAKRLCYFRTFARLAVSQTGKSFLLLFFKKEVLP
jgi:hypothetical protein